MTDEQLLADAKDAFALCEETESENRLAALDDLRFAKLGEQWPESVRQQRIKDGRPCLTINRQPAFIRQVVNEARQNRPGINVHPVDSEADPEIAEIYNGLIRNIEQTSKADVAYDTAVDGAVSNGFGYFRIGTEFADDDSFDLDLRIERIANPFSVYGDPLSTASDSSDWNQCFVTEVLSLDAFRAKYKGAAPVNWFGSGYEKLAAPWAQDKSVLVAEWWRRERVKRPIVALSDGSVLDLEVYVRQKAQLDASGVTVMGERLALDITAPVGTPVVAAGDGTVANIQPNPSKDYGNQVVISHPDGFYTQYGHLSRIDVAPGTTVHAGDQIGLSGTSGNVWKGDNHHPAADPHLHFEVRRGSMRPHSTGGQVVDPIQYLPVTP